MLKNWTWLQKTLWMEGSLITEWIAADVKTAASLLIAPFFVDMGQKYTQHR